MPQRQRTKGGPLQMPPESRTVKLPSAVTGSWPGRDAQPVEAAVALQVAKRSAGARGGHSERAQRPGVIGDSGIPGIFTFGRVIRFPRPFDASVDGTNGTSIGRKLNWHNKFRITGDFVLCCPAGPQPLKGPKKAEPSWRRAVSPVTFGGVSICHKMAYA